MGERCGCRGSLNIARGGSISSGKVRSGSPRVGVITQFARRTSDNDMECSSHDTDGF